MMQMMMSARELRITKIIHTSEWINFVGPFEDEAAALAWIRNHFLEDAKVEIHKMQMPSTKNVASAAGGDGGRRSPERARTPSFAAARCT
jgi:hypothetical protein